MIHPLVFSLVLLLFPAGGHLNAAQSAKPKSGPELVIEAASKLMPKEQKQFNMFYYPPKSRLVDSTTKLIKLLQKNDMKGKLLVIGSEDTSLLPNVIKEVFPKFYPDRLQGVHFILVGSREQKEDLLNIVKGTGANCLFGELPGSAIK